MGLLSIFVSILVLTIVATFLHSYTEEGAFSDFEPYLSQNTNPALHLEYMQRQQRTVWPQGGTVIGSNNYKKQKNRNGHYNGSQKQSEIIATYIGTSTILFHDGEEAVLIDGFFTRNAGHARGFLQMAGLFANPWSSIHSNVTAVKEALCRLNLYDSCSQFYETGNDKDNNNNNTNNSDNNTLENKMLKLRAVAVAHSHHDHALDSALICKLTGAVLVGSNSTANLARFQREQTSADIDDDDDFVDTLLPENQIEVVTSRLDTLSSPSASSTSSPSASSVYQFGQFSLRLIESRHGHLPALIKRMIIDLNIPNPLPQPSHIASYKEGGTYSILVSHAASGVTSLVHASPGYVPGALKDIRADVVFLGVGGVGSASSNAQESYWSQVVGHVHPHTVVPIHWDDFSIPLDAPTRAMPKFQAGIQALQAQFQKEQKTQKEDPIEEDKNVLKHWTFMPIWSSISLKTKPDPIIML